MSLFYHVYTTAQLRASYSRLLVPISLQELVPETTIQPPILKRQAGRPRTKRIRKGAWKRNQTRCLSCLEWGHNKRGCRGQPVPSGRRERARDWLYEVGDNEENILLGNSEEESNSELSELTSDLYTIEVLTEEADEAIESEIEEGTEDVIEVVLKVWYTRIKCTKV
jgi:hypothetical protein